MTTPQAPVVTQSRFSVEPGRAWGWVLASGVLSLLLGLAILLTSNETRAWVLAVWIGVGLLSMGAERLVLAGVQHDRRGWAIGTGVVFLVAGVGVLVFPAAALWILALTIGLMGVVGGVVDLVGAIAGWRVPRGLAAARGLVSLLIGVVVLVWPSETLVVLAVLLGAFLLMQGLFSIVAALLLRRAAKDLAAGGSRGSVVTVTTVDDGAGQVAQITQVDDLPARP